MLSQASLIPWQAAVFCGGVICGLLTELFSAGWLTTLRSVVAILALVAAWPGSARQSRAVAFSLVGAGLLLCTRAAEPVSLVRGLGEMLPVVSLLACASTMGIPVRLGNYGSVIEAVLARYRRNSSKHLNCSLMAYLLTVLASLGSVPISYHVLARVAGALPRRERDYFVATAITRGFAMAVLWSPVAATVGIALDCTNLSWVSFAPRALLLSAVGLGLGTLLVKRENKEENGKDAGNRSHCLFRETGAAPAAQVGSLGGLLGGTVALIALFERFLGAGSLGSIALGCVAASLAWGGLTGRTCSVLREVRTYFLKDIMALGDQILLLVAAGFFAAALREAGIASHLGRVVTTLAHAHGWGIALLLLPSCIIVLALFGFHPFASTVVLAKSLGPGLAGVLPVSVALALTTGAALAFTVSPFTAVTSFVAAQTGRTSLEVGLKWNSLYAIVLLVVSCFLNPLLSR